MADNKEMKIQRLFGKACAEYSLLEDGDRVLVAVSGGKDSLELVRLMGRQQRILKPRIEVEATHVVSPFYETDTEYLRRFCEEAGVKLNILRSDPTSNPHKGGGNNKKTPCFICSWYRRKAIFQYVAEKGFNKVALGHHQDDILTTLLMNMTFGGSMQTMPPRLRMEHYPLTVIRPLCLVPEHLIAEHARVMGFERQRKPCPHERVTRRKAMNDIFHALERMNPEARYSLWSSMKNIHKNLLV